jgi:hypothetical protein
MTKLWPHRYSTLEPVPEALKSLEREVDQEAAALRQEIIAAARRAPGGVGALIGSTPVRQGPKHPGTSSLSF